MADAVGLVESSLSNTELDRRRARRWVVDQAKADIRADIYGLGATLYALLIGRPPLRSDYLPDLLAKIRNEEPEKPKRYHLSIPDLFQDAVLEMLAKRPDDRYKTPAEMLKDLDRVGRYPGVWV